MAKKNIQIKEMKEEKRKKLKRRVTQKGELESEAEPKKKKRSLQAADEEEDLTPEERRKLERKLKKERKKEEKKLMREAGISAKKAEPKKLSGSELALAYLTSWSENPKEWKFQKTRQTWLLSHMYEKEKISEKYGPVFTVHLGMQQAVVLSGYEAVKDALLNTADAFADRPAIPIFHHIQHGNGVFFSSQELWKTTRRFTLAAMRELGMGKRLAEERMLEELQFLTELIKSFQGGQFRLRLLNAAPTNITFAILFGRRFDYADPTFVTLLRLIDEVMLLLGSPFLHLFNFYPFLGFLLKPHKMILKKVEEVCVILKKRIQESKAKINGNSLMSYIDALVFKQEEDNKSNTIFHDANVLASALDLLMAGTETASTTLQWAVLLVMRYPEIQSETTLWAS